MNYKVVIVGAGPAGVSAAYHLAKKGVNCCLIDKCTFPRFKLCGGLLTEKTINLLKEYNFDDWESVIKNKVNKVNIFSKGNRIVTVETKRYFYLVDREEFDNWLLNKYIKLGGALRLGEKVEKISLDKKELITSKETITFEYLIGADGAKGITSKLIKRKAIPYAFGLETEVPTVLSKGNLDSIDLDVSVACDGYSWRFPKGETTMFGVACSYKKNNSCLDLAKTVLPKGAKVKGAFLPYGGGVKTVVDKNGLLLVGDAAGFVDSVTGEGTYYALKSGEIAAESFAHENPLNWYKKNIGYIIKGVNKSWRLIKLFYKFRNTILQIAKNHHRFVGFVCDNQVAIQKCDYSIFKMLYFYKKGEKNG
ncbi:MAG: geranylgeranyl reductase family protein [Lachnospiraceae bacterium]|nr:geranylgeranyl reductase family protein [Lachnospiraceae bacterium]